MRTLVVISHPNFAGSATQNFLRATADLEQGNNTTVVLDTLADDARSALWQQVLSADRIILQFPLYWYSAPASLWSWLDDEWTDRHVSVGRDAKLKGKSLGLVVSTGHPDAAFRVGGAENVDLDTLMSPFRTLARKAGMVLLPALYINDFAHQDDQQRAATFIQYRQLLSMAHPGDELAAAAWYAERVRAFGDDLVATELTDRDDELQQMRGVIGDLRQGGKD